MLFALLALCVFLIDEAIASNLPHFFEFGGQDAKLAMSGDDTLLLGERCARARLPGADQSDGWRDCPRVAPPSDITPDTTRGRIARRLPHAPHDALPASAG